MSISLDDLKLSDEQQTKLKEYLKEERTKAVAEYTEKAQWFRTWLRKHDQVWVAQHVAGTIIITEIVAYILYYVTRAG